MMAILVKAEPLEPADRMRDVKLDDYAAALARRFGLQLGTFERDLAETDAAYRPRPLKMIRDSVEAP